jgi:hypothetical protein
MHASIRLGAALLLMLATSVASAQTRAWVDRDRIALGETTTLNIQTDQVTTAGPDYAPLLRDFIVSGNSSSRQFELVNGVASQHMLFAVALQPRRDGLMTIPSLKVGNQRTQPLSLTVSPQAAAPAHGDGAVFIDTEADAQAPYVQQAVGYTVRLYYATPLISGQLDQDPPDGASLQRVGEDAQYTREVGGRPYTVVERHYLLVPERSGTLTIPGARFQGRTAGGFFDDLLGDGERELHAASAPRVISVRPAPANAPQPWLPLRSLTLRYVDAPQAARAGEATTVTVELTADGATTSQLPELQLSAGDGAQVFAEAPQSDDSFKDGRPQVRLVRRFSIVPARAGSLRIPGPRMRWWDVRAGVTRTASLPDLVLQVAPGAHGAGAGTTQDRPGRDGDIRVPGVQHPVQGWALAAAVFAGLWLVTLAWALQRRVAPMRDAMPGQAADRPVARSTQADLKRALDHGDLADVADVLCSLCVPSASDLDALRLRLADPEQVEAVDALQRARWGGGDGVEARRALRAAFKSKAKWRSSTGVVPQDTLPPLYPPG